MNYIKALKATVAKLEDEKSCLLDGLHRINTYLCSPKFHGEGNNYVNPNDIITRIWEVLHECSDIAMRDIETYPDYQ